MPKHSLTEKEIDFLIGRVEELFQAYIEKFGFNPQFLFFDVETFFDWEEIMWKRFGIPPNEHNPKNKVFRTYRNCEIICMFAEHQEGRIILA